MSLKVSDAQLDGYPEIWIAKILPINRMFNKSTGKYTGIKDNWLIY
jgi:hypothetical protein